jgi:hypothetical protein
VIAGCLVGYDAREAVAIDKLHALASVDLRYGHTPYISLTASQYFFASSMM